MPDEKRDFNVVECSFILDYQEVVKSTWKMYTHGRVRLDQSNEKIHHTLD